MNIKKYIINKRISYIPIVMIIVIILASFMIFTLFFKEKPNITQDNDTQNTQNTIGNNPSSSNETINTVNSSASVQTKVTTLASDFVTTPNKFGNTPMNISNGGYIATQDKWLYYNPVNGTINNTSANGIYRSMLDGSTGLQKLCEDNAAYINVVGSWIYYKNLGTPGIWKIKINGEEKTKISNDNGISLNVIEDWIYYLDSSKSVLCKIKTDGSSKEEIINAYNYTLSADRQWIYFSGVNDGLYKMKIQSNETLKLCDERPSNIKIDADWIYGLVSNGSSTNNSAQLLTLKSDGSNKNMRRYEFNNLITINDGYIYYLKSSSSNSITTRGGRFGLYKSKTNSTKEERLGIGTFLNTSLITIFDDTIYFFTSSDSILTPSFSLYKIKTDGREAYTSTPQVGKFFLNNK